MNRDDFIKLIGAESKKADYLPVACLLRTGYACAGYYFRALNTDVEETCVLLNTRLVSFNDSQKSKRGFIEDFTEFLEEIVMRAYGADADSEIDLEVEEGNSIYGKSIPLAAIPYDEISVVYPVAKISEMMRRLQQDENRVPAFFDFDNKSIIVKILRTKLW